MTLSGAVGTTVAVEDTVEMIMEAVVVSFLVEVVVMVKGISKGEGEVGGQADQNRMLFWTEVLNDFWEIVLWPLFLGIFLELSSHPHLSFTAFAQL